MNPCPICAIPQDAGFFDESNITEAPQLGQEKVLARYQLHREYCGILMYFAQFTDRFAGEPSEVLTPGYQWQIRCNRQPRAPYLSIGHIINPWGLSGFPLYLRLEEGCTLELAVRHVGDDQGKTLTTVGGRILGRTWYNAVHGGAPNRL